MKKTKAPYRSRITIRTKTKKKTKKNILENTFRRITVRRAIKDEATIEAEKEEHKSSLPHQQFKLKSNP